MSFGGVIGGVFAGIVAPQIFAATYEFPLLLTLGMMCRPGVFGNATESETRGLKLIAGVTAAALIAGLIITHATSDQQGWTFGVTLVALGLAAIFACSHSAKLQLLLVAALSAVVIILPSTLNRGNPSRSFFGVLRVVEAEGGQVRRFLHGTTNHGAQRLVDAGGKAILPPVPATYYHPASPMAQAVDVARHFKAADARPFRVGIIGLGIGSMACYSKPSEAWRFYEIDPAVLTIAADATKFNFLSACRPNAYVVLGDARLTIAREASASFDYLQVDAFSSDAVPTHLLTVEAVKLYLDKVTDNGMLTMHVSNRHLDLAPVAAAAALSVPGTSVTIVNSVPDGQSIDATPSVVVVITKRAEPMQAALAWQGAAPQKQATVTPWTDDYSDIISALWRVYGPAK